MRTARLRHLANGDKRVALVLSAYPTKRARLGNAVGLDTPASAIELLHALRDAGYRVDRIPADGDALMDELAAGFTYDQPELTAGAGGGGRRVVGRVRVRRLVRGAARPTPATRVEAVWGPAPGEVYVAGGALQFPGHRPRRRAGHDPAAARASGPTRSARTTPPTSRRPTTTWRSTAG